MGVRNTWMRFITERRVENVSAIFLIGNNNAANNVSGTISKKILEEQNKFGDLLQADMVDHYNNLTLKSVFTMKFFVDESNFYSPPPSIVMKIDNDAYLNLPQLQSLVQDDKLAKAPKYLVGHR